MLSKPFYDPLLSYEDNYTNGPFGEFKAKEKYKNKGKPQFDFLGQKVFLPFGIPAGPLLNSKFVKGAFQKGFDIAVYKTVRADVFSCHPFPNVLALNNPGKITLRKLEKPLVAHNKYKDPLSITNSFGVPSRKPDVWQEDVKKAISYTGEGQVMVLSFMGTVKKGQTQRQFIEDFVLTARLAHETKAKVLEANLSCPNIGNEGLVCYNLDVTEKILKAIRNVIGNTPFIIKVGYYKEDEQLKKLAEIANEYVNDIAGINTLQGIIVDKSGEQALPGPNRLRSGVCGDGIRWAGIDFVKRLKNIKDKNNYNFSITGVGGVMNAKHYKEFKKAGADVVMSATGSMWNPNLAIEIKEKGNGNLLRNAL